MTVTILDTLAGTTAAGVDMRATFDTGRVEGSWGIGEMAAVGMIFLGKIAVGCTGVVGGTRLLLL